MPRKRQKNWEGEWTSSFAEDCKVNAELRKLTNSAGWVGATSKPDSRSSPGSSRASTPPSVTVTPPSSTSRKSEPKNSIKLKPEKKRRGRPPGKGKSKKFKMVLEKDAEYEVDYVSPDDEITADDSDDSESKDLTSDVLSNDDYNSLGEEDAISSVGEPVSWIEDEFSDIELDEDAPKLNYPPSSLDLLIPNQLVLSALEVYEILRHFRSCLRLSPMLFEDFCAALIDEETNILLTECFVAVLKSLLKEEDAASVSFGPQDQKDAIHAAFNFLDHLTWPEVVKSYLESSSEFSEALAIVENVKFPCVGAADKITVLKTLTDMYLTSNKIRDQLMKDGVIQYDDHCRVCHKLGDLLCCETCSAVYHLACCDPPLEEVPDDEWHCEVCTAHKLNGVYNCEPQHEFRGQYLRHDPIGTDRHGNKYWFLARRLIIENENESWYYSTQQQFDQVASMLDPEKYEMVLCEALKDTADEFPKYSAITRSLTEEALPEDKNKSYLDVATARLKKEERERKQELEKKKREEEVRAKKEREERMKKEETKEKSENAEANNEISENGKEEDNDKTSDSAQLPPNEVPAQDKNASDAVGESDAMSTIGASGDSNTTAAAETIKNKTNVNMTINAAGDSNATAPTIVSAIPATITTASKTAAPINHIDSSVPGTDASKTVSATSPVPGQTESKLSSTPGAGSNVTSGAPPSAKALAPIPVTMQSSPAKNIQLFKLGQGIQIKKPVISASSSSPGLSSGTVSQLKSLFVLNKDGTKTQIMLGPAGKIVAPGNNGNQSLNRQILVLNSSKVSIPKLNSDIKKVQMTTSPGNSVVASNQNLKIVQVPKVEIKEEEEDLTPEEESRKYFRLGEDKAYKQYVNHFTENTLALNKYQHKEERDRERHLGYKFSMSGQGEFKWIGDMLGNEMTVIQSIRSTLLHLEHQIPLCFMHARWDKYRKAWGKIVMKCSTPQSFAAALGILEMATRAIIKRSIWKDSLGLTKLQRATTSEKEEFEKKRKYKNRVEEDESNKNAVWCKYPIPVRSTLVWKMKGEEYRMTGYGGWCWMSSTRRYVHSPAKPKPFVLVHDVKNVNQQTATADHSTVSVKQETPSSSSDLETDSEKSQSTTSTTSTKSIDYSEDKNVHDSLIEEASSKDILMSNADPITSQSQVKPETACDQFTAPVCDVINVSENLLKRTPLYNKKWAASKVDILLGWRLMQREAEKKREPVSSKVPPPKPIMPDLQKIKDVTTTTNVINPSKVIMSSDVNISMALKTPGMVTQVSLKDEVKGAKVELKDEVKSEGAKVELKDDVIGKDAKMEPKNEIEGDDTKIEKPTNEKQSTQTDVLQSVKEENHTSDKDIEGMTPVATSTIEATTMDTSCQKIKDNDENSLQPGKSKQDNLIDAQTATLSSTAAPTDTNKAVPDEVMEVTTESIEEMVDTVTDTITATKTIALQDVTTIETVVTTVSTTVGINKTVVSVKNSFPQPNAVQSSSHHTDTQPSLEQNVVHSSPPINVAQPFTKEPSLNQNVAPPPPQDPITITTMERSRTRMTRMSRMKRERNRTQDGAKVSVTEKVWKLKRYRKTSATIKREQAMKLPLPWKFDAGKGKRKSIFRLPSSPLRKLALSGGMWSYGAGFNYNTKFLNGLDMFWIYSCPRPVFSMVWRYKLQKVCTFASISHLLRMFWHSIKWEAITTKPQTDDVVHTVTTDEEIVTTELLKRKDNLKTGMKSEYFIRRITMPILDPEEEALRSIKPGENYTPSRKGLRSSTRPIALRDRPKKESGPNVEMIWVLEDQVQLWQIRQFDSLLKQQQTNQKFQQNLPQKTINYGGNTFISTPSGALLPTLQMTKEIKTEMSPGFNVVKLPLSNQNQRLVSAIQQRNMQSQQSFLTRPKTYSMMVGKPGQVQKIIVQPPGTQTYPPFQARVNQSPQQTFVRGPSGINYIVQGNKMLKPIIIKAGSQVVTSPVQTKQVHPTIRLNDGSSPIIKFQQSPAAAVGRGGNIRHQILQHRIQSSPAPITSKIAPKAPKQTQIKLTSAQLSQLMKVSTGTSVRVSVSLGNGKTGIGQLQIIPPGAQVTPSSGQQLMQTKVGGEVRRFLFTLLTENNSNVPSAVQSSNEVSLNSASLHQRLQQIQKHQHAASGIRGTINNSRQSTDMKRLLTDKDPLWGSRPLTPERSQIIRRDERVERPRKKPMNREEREDTQRHSVIVQVMKSILDRIERKEELDMRKKKKDEIIMKQKEKKELSEQAKAQNRQNHFLNKHRDQLKQDILKRRAIVEKYLTHSIKNELREDQKKQRRQYSSAPAGGEGPVSKKPKKAYGNAIVTSAVLTENNSKQRQMSQEKKQIHQPIAGKKRKLSSPPHDNKKLKMINTHHRKKDNKLYCVCKTPYDATRFYIGCDLCVNWFHGSCVGIPESQAKQMDEWVCDECKKAREQPAQELYCLCKTPYDDSKFYIGCDICQDWYHGSCVGVTEIESSKIEFYTCPRCKRESRDNVLAENNLSLDDYIILSKVIKSMRSHKMAWPFLHPVNALEVPNYYKIVKRPMDLGTVTKKLKIYKKLSELVSDVSLIFDNCRQFNGADSALAKCAEIVESLFVGKMREFRSKRGSK